jgi:uncharacterized protein YciI
LNWQQGLDCDDQLGSREHQAYLQKRYANYILLMSGPLDNHQDGANRGKRRCVADDKIAPYTIKRSNADVAINIIDN